MMQRQEISSTRELPHTHTHTNTLCTVGQQQHKHIQEAQDYKEDIRKFISMREDDYRKKTFIILVIVVSLSIPIAYRSSLRSLIYSLSSWQIAVAEALTTDN